MAHRPIGSHARTRRLVEEAANGTRLSGRALQCFIKIDCRPNATQPDGSCPDSRRFEHGARRQASNSVFFCPNVDTQVQVHDLTSTGGFRFQVGSHTVRVPVPVEPSGPLCRISRRNQRSSVRFSGVRPGLILHVNTITILVAMLWKRFRKARGGVDAAWTRRG